VTSTSSTGGASQLIHPADADDSDGDEPLLSGSGHVNRDTPEEVLRQWLAIIETFVHVDTILQLHNKCRWRTTGERPTELAGLVRDGVPDNLRPDVWPLLTGAKQEEIDDLIAAYKLLGDKVFIYFSVGQYKEMLRSVHLSKSYYVIFIAHFPHMIISKMQTEEDKMRFTI
jgi:hypothetical protein